MMDFHDRLRARKEEIKAEQGLNKPDYTVSESDQRRIDFEYKVQEVIKKIKTIAIGAALIIGLISLFIVKDWWNFIGSKEYSEWKTRVEGK